MFRQQQHDAGETVLAVSLRSTTEDATTRKKKKRKNPNNSPPPPMTADPPMAASFAGGDSGGNGIDALSSLLFNTPSSAMITTNTIGNGDEDSERIISLFQNYRTPENTTIPTRQEVLDAISPHQHRLQDYHVILSRLLEAPPQMWHMNMWRMIEHYMQMESDLPTVMNQLNEDIYNFLAYGTAPTPTSTASLFHTRNAAKKAPVEGIEPLPYGYVTSTSDEESFGNIEDEDDQKYTRNIQDQRNLQADANVEKLHSTPQPAQQAYPNVRGQVDKETLITLKKKKTTTLSTHHKRFDTASKDFH